MTEIEVIDSIIVIVKDLLDKFVVTAAEPSIACQRNTVGSRDRSHQYSTKKVLMENSSNFQGNDTYPPYFTSL